MDPRGTHLSTVKAKEGNFIAFHKLVLDLFGSNLFGPIHLQEGFQWPYLQDMLNKIIIVISGNPDARRRYYSDLGTNPGIHQIPFLLIV